jgi:hypothetical protein
MKTLHRIAVAAGLVLSCAVLATTLNAQEAAELAFEAESPFNALGGSSEITARSQCATVLVR